MKVTQLMISKGFGGAERYFVDLCAALGQRGVAVQAICHRRFVRRAELEESYGVDVCPVMVRGTWDVLAQSAINRLVGKHCPGVLHAHLARGSHFAGRAGAKLGLPVTAKTHNYVDLKYYQHVDHFIATTLKQRQYLLDKGIEASRITVIPNFTRLPGVEALPAPSAHESVFMSYGRMVQKKGFDVLLSAFRQYLDRTHAGYLLLGGDGPESIALKRLAADLGIGDRVRFCGWVEDVSAFLDQGDIFVLPSRDEPFGIVVLEAMARGKALISTRTQGPMEILDAETARLVEPGESPSLALAMEETALDRSGREARAARALRVFRERYSEAAVVPQLVQLYTSLARVR